MFSIEVQMSEVAGERRVIIQGQGTKFARTLDEAVKKVGDHLRGLQRVGIPMREQDISDALSQVRTNWR